MYAYVTLVTQHNFVYNTLYTYNKYKYVQVHIYS